jgi:hypothetical protein
MMRTGARQAAWTGGVARWAAALALGFAVTGCMSTDEPPRPGAAATPASMSERPTSLRREQLVGRWGVASFRQDKDRPRVEAMARSFCARQPYEITAGPNQGVMMHVADDSKLYELRLKGGADGKTYLGFEAPPGDAQDREIISVADGRMVMRFVDPDANNRYGTFIYVRCA